MTLIVNDEADSKQMQQTDSTTKKLIRPKGIETLQEDYGFNGYDVARSAYLLQRTTNSYMPKIEVHHYFNWVPQTSGADIPSWQMMRWNLPVCDLVEDAIAYSCVKGHGWANVRLSSF